MSDSARKTTSQIQQPASRRDNLNKRSPDGQPSGAHAGILSLQRAAGNRAVTRSLEVPPIVGEQIGLPGRPLDPITRKVMESRFQRDFGNVRLHEGARASEAARAVQARAYTVGRDIVMGAGSHPTPSARLGILAHELAHVAQQRSRVEPTSGALEIGPANGHLERSANRAASQVMTNGRGSVTAQPTISASGPTLLQRVGIWESIARFFGGGTFSSAELDSYIMNLEARDRIEDEIDSDQKAREIVNAWKAGGSRYNLTPRLKILLIQEMLSGATLDDDEIAILEILERSYSTELSTILAAIDPEDLNSNFHFEEQDRLDDFFRRRFDGGAAKVLTGHIRPVGDPVPLGRPLPPLSDKAVDQATPNEQDACRTDSPGACPTYQEWISTFARLPTFAADDAIPRAQRANSIFLGGRHTVIGPSAAPEATATDIDAPPSKRRPPAVHYADDYLPADRFIDGPTESWLRANLPPNLIETAYQLPSDCADLAVILRHVWLSAHHREETYDAGASGVWQIGSGTGAARSKHILDLIRNQIYSGNVAQTINPYADEQGRPIRSFRRLQRLLHPGDVLVWEHRDDQGNRSGGHTQTVVSLDPGRGTVARITALQGNQPINEAEAKLYRERAQAAGQIAETPSVERLREAPGRRIEISVLEDEELADVSGVWTWPDGTVLVAAGPPAAAPAPASRRQDQRRPQRLTDWVPSLESARNNQLQGVFEAALLEARAMLEGGQKLPLADAREVGRAAGERLWRFAREANDLANESHYQRLQVFRKILEATRDASHAQAAIGTFNALLEAFEFAARGATGIDFDRRLGRDTQLVKVLVTGFDPFNVSNIAAEPRRGEWNPSAAAALALDGAKIRVGRGVVAAVESVVLPVSFAQFRSGLVESILKQPALREVDAVITVSLDPGIAPNQPVDIERYAVGVHQLINDRLEPIPAGPKGEGRNAPLIIQAPAPVEEIARETGAPARRGQPEVQQPTIGTDIEFAFSNVTSANRALSALGLPPQGRATVTISDPRAIQQIISTMSRSGGAQEGSISFTTANGQRFRASIVSGPGGSFLSNEVSYRVLRSLLNQQGQRKPLSFHVHTQRGTEQVAGVLPEDLTTPEGEKALRLARDVRETLIRTLQRMIIAVAKRTGAGDSEEE